jgi:CRISPR-associated endonuclease/helicase Cas3
MNENPVAELTDADFPAFFEEVHGWRPFPWQRELLRRVLDRGWPSLIDVPTGLGKTAVLDVAVFVSALRSEYARRRIFLVVDRRLIVDQSHEHAESIQRALADAMPGTVCHAVAQRLAAVGDDDGPVLDVTRMRGGVTWSWLWLERPDRHAVITGTVDQVGSRLLFRGYGVGEQLRPIDAALVGTDSLIIVDEAHLSDAFMSTLRSIQEAGTGPAQVGPQSIVVAMSASPGEDRADTHSISKDDEEDPLAGHRLRAAKALHLVKVSSAGDAASGAVAHALAHWCLQLGGPGTVTGVVANTVDMARRVFNLLRTELADPETCVLLTGRVRPIDREYLQHTWYPRIRAGAERPGEQGLYVVATQTIEVGADIDLDGLVTESASLQAVVQRLGRLNRRGDRPGTAVLVHADSLQDRVYGSARQETWNWLTSLAEPISHRANRTLTDLGQSIYASPLALSGLVGDLPESLQDGMRGGIPYAPFISSVTLDTWARTSPAPHPDIPVEPYLHGIGSGEPTASVIWRADVSGNDASQWRRSAERMPPNSDEAIELPISSLRRWLNASPSLDVSLSDLESQPAPEIDEKPDGVNVLRYRGGNSFLSVGPEQVRPGDLIVVPASRGGCDRYGWNPTSTTQVIDVADLTSVRLARRSRSAGTGARYAVAVRVSPWLDTALRVLAPDLAVPVGRLMSQISVDVAEESADDVSYRKDLSLILSELDTEGATALPHMRILRSLASSGRLTVLDGDTAGDGISALLATRSASWGDDASVAGTSANVEARPMTLLAHQAAVRDRAAQFALNLGLTTPLRNAVLIAAAHHDEGKRDPRFQIMLHRGDKWRSLAANEPLAKSGMDPVDKAALRLAHQLSGYPSKMRHESLSARITELILSQGAGEVAIAAARRKSALHGEQPMDSSAAEAEEVDKELVVHLVATHHGWGRPLLPPTADPKPEEVDVLWQGVSLASLSTADTVDWEGPRRFALLNMRYGRWGLALLETVVRLADIWCSARSEESS